MQIKQFEIQTFLGPKETRRLITIGDSPIRSGAFFAYRNPLHSLFNRESVCVCVLNGGSCQKLGLLTR